MRAELLARKPPATSTYSDRIIVTEHFGSRYVMCPGLARRAPSRRYAPAAPIRTDLVRIGECVVLTLRPARVRPPAVARRPARSPAAARSAPAAPRRR